MTAVVTYLPAPSPSKCELARFTSSRLGQWADARTIAIQWHVSSAESPAPTRVPDDLITAAEAANKIAASLDAIRLPEGLALGGENSLADCIVHLSRPGISAEGNRALVDVRVDAGNASIRCMSGLIYVLEKRDGRWRVKGEGDRWITDCLRLVGKQH